MACTDKATLAHSLCLSCRAEWVKVSTEASVSQPKPSMAHVAGAFKDGKVVVFGGCTSSCCFGRWGRR